MFYLFVRFIYLYICWTFASNRKAQISCFWPEAEDSFYQRTLHQSTSMFHSTQSNLNRILLVCFCSTIQCKLCTIQCVGDIDISARNITNVATDAAGRVNTLEGKVTTLETALFASTTKITALETALTDQPNRCLGCLG